MSVWYAPADVASAQGRELIVCCDGTGNIWGNGHDTNVVKLVRRLASSERQIVYYDPGVGTTDNFPPIGFWNTFKALISRVLGLALALGIYEDIGKGYEFLVDNYRRGDRIYLFGFSRGAFTARCIGGMVNLFGIVRPSAKQMIPVMVRSYFFPTDKGTRGRKAADRKSIADDIRENFCGAEGRDAFVYFVGVWDTVASVGGIRNLKMSADANMAEKRYVHIRHAVSLDEYRYKYEPRLYLGTEQQLIGTGRTFKQVAFSGSHSDVGGSYEDAALSNIALAWIVDEARAAAPQLLFKRDPTDESDRLENRGEPLGLAHDEPCSQPLWALAGLARRAMGDHTIVHPSVGQRLAAPSEPPSVWRPLLARKWFWISLVALLASGAFAMRPCFMAQTSALTVMQRFLASYAYQAWPARYFQSSGVCTTDHVSHATWADLLLFIPSYICFLAVLLVYAHRRLLGPRPAPGITRPALLYSLLTLMLADVAEDLLVIVAAHIDNPDSWWVQAPIQLFSGLKIAGVFAVVAFVGSLLLARMRGSEVSQSKSPSPAE